MRDLESYKINYNENRSFDDVLVNCRKKILRKLPKAGKGLNILEIGCGVDSFINLFPGFKTYTVVEPISDFLDKNKAKFDAHENVYIHNAVLEEFKENNKFDLILISSLLHEVNNIEIFLDKVKSLCQKGTLVHTNVPNQNSLHRKLGLEMGILKNSHEISETGNRFQRKREFSLDKLVRCFPVQEYKVLDSGSYFFKPFSSEQLKKVLDFQIIDENTIDAMFNLGCHEDIEGAEIFVLVEFL